MLNSIRLHKLAVGLSIERLMQMPLTNLITVLMIAFGLALPSGLLVLLKDVRQVTHTWQRHETVSLYLQHTVSEQQATQLMDQLRRQFQLKTLRYISPRQGWQEFAKHMGIVGLLNQLQTNPIPGVIELQLLPRTNPVNNALLMAQLRQMPQVMQVENNIAWVQKLNAIIRIIEQLIVAFGVLLLLTVFLIINHTIRLSLRDYHTEIEVYQLVGAANSFIRRPFLYMGFFYGVLSGLLAGLIVDFVVAYLQKPVRDLALLYNSSFHLQDLGVSEVGSLCLASMLLGLLAAYLAVHKKIRHVTL